MKNKNQSVKLFILTGKKFEFSVDEFLALVKTPALYTVILFAVVIDYMAKDFPLADGQGSVLPFVLWAISIIVTMLVYFGTLLFLCTVNVESHVKFVFEPFVSFFASAISSIFGGPLFVHANMNIGLKFYTTLEGIFTTYAAAQVATILYVYLVRPGILAQLKDNEPAPNTEMQSRLLIGGKAFSAARIRYIKSENQYIHVYTDFDDTLLLGAIKEVAEQLDAGLGMIVHRSYYVMHRDVLRIEKDGAQRALILTDATRIPLARRRAAEVEAWFKGE